jgi:DNA-binding MarR family transcriptional regulator
VDEAVSTGAGERGELLDALRRELRLSSSLGVLFSDAVAERLGINSTDMESVDFLNLYGPMTPGRMGELTGLSSGGVTRLIDRLARAGYVRREADARDRRKVIIVPTWEASDSHVMPLFAGMAREMGALMESYSSEELRVILGFMERSTAIASGEIARVRGLPPGEEGAGG